MKIENKISVNNEIEFCDAMDGYSFKLVMESDGDYLDLTVSTSEGTPICTVKRASKNFYTFKDIIYVVCRELAAITGDRLTIGPKTVREFYPVVDSLILRPTLLST